jgi:hypothetical protein
LLRPKRLNAAEFDAFLRRQTEALQARRVDEMLKSAAAIVTPPPLCRRSVELAETRLSPSFSARRAVRVAAELSPGEMKRRTEQLEEPQRRTADRDRRLVTFAPELSARSLRKAAQRAPPERLVAEERKTLTVAPETRGVPADLRKISASIERIRQLEAQAARRSYSELALHGQQTK